MIPSVQLHVHLEGLLPAALLRDFCRQGREDLSGLFLSHGPGGYAPARGRDLRARLDAAMGLVRTPEQTLRLMGAGLDLLTSDGTAHAEILVQPAQLGHGDAGAFRDHLLALNEAIAPFEAAGGTSITLIAAIPRHLGPEAGRRAALAAAENAGDRLRGLALIGDERIGAHADHGWAFDCGREAGLVALVEAGLHDGPASVRGALQALRPARILGGLQAAQDPGLLEELAECGIGVDLAPGTDIAAGLVADWPAHPLPQFEKRGVTISLSVPFPCWSPCGILQEYAMLNRYFDWDEGQIVQVNRQALDVALRAADIREPVTRKLESV